jgi:hypothetical protein
MGRVSFAVNKAVDDTLNKTQEDFKKTSNKKKG